MLILILNLLILSCTFVQVAKHGYSEHKKVAAFKLLSFNADDKRYALNNPFKYNGNPRECAD